MADRDDGRAADEAAERLLEWYLDAGVDAFVGETPRDRFAETRAEDARRAEAAGVRQAPPAVASAGLGAGAPSPRPPAEPDVRLPAPAGAAPRSAGDARADAAKAGSLEALEELLRGFEGSSLKRTARSLVFGSGDPRAEVMLVGEAPGREEDETGQPFVGRSGRLLDRMLAAIGLKREAVRVTNTLPWRPPGNRTPTPAETEMFLPFLKRHIELVQPRVIVCLGSPAAKTVLRAEDGILKLRGRWFDYPLDGPGGQRPVPATAMLHPAYLLRQPAQKRLAWRDLLALRARLDALGFR